MGVCVRAISRGPDRLTRADRRAAVGGRNQTKQDSLTSPDRGVAGVFGRLGKVAAADLYNRSEGRRLVQKRLQQRTDTGVEFLQRSTNGGRSCGGRIADTRQVRRVAATHPKRTPDYSTNTAAEPGR